MKLRDLLYQHKQAAFQSLKQLCSKPMSSLITIIVLAVALTLPATLFVALKTMNRLTESWQNTTQISLYLKQNLTHLQSKQLMNRLRGSDEIRKLEFISPEQGLDQLSKETEMGDILKTFDRNPIPGVIIVMPSQQAQSSEALQRLFYRLKNLEGVESAKLNMTWVNRLQALIHLGERVAQGLSIFLGLGVLFIIGHTIHLSTKEQRDEIEVYQLIGASNAFIRRPFLYTGIWYGLAGGLICWLLITVFAFILQTPIQKLSALYQSQFHLHGLDLQQTITLFVVSSALGFCGAFFAAQREL